MRSVPRTLYLTITNDDAFLSPYWSKVPVLSSEAGAMLEQRIAVFSMKELKDFRIEIESDVISKGEQDIYRRAIHSYFKDERKRARLQEKRNFASAALLFLVGLLILAGHALFQDLVFAEVIDIAGWVFIWQATSQFWLDSFSLFSQAKRAKALEQVEIDFVPLPHKAKHFEQELEEKVETNLP